MKKIEHQLTMDEQAETGDWLVECYCGWSEVYSNEMAAMNGLSEHSDSTKGKP